MSEIDMSTLWYQTNLDIFLNRWFSNYDDARRAREAEGGFLLPYKHHFFVCKAEVIRALGLSPMIRIGKRLNGIVRGRKIWKRFSVCVKSGSGSWQIGNG